MNTPAEPRDPVASEAVTAMLPLGDATGRNQVLAGGLEAIKDYLDRETAGGGYWLHEWLARCKDPFEWCATELPAAVSGVAERFVARQVALVRAEAEAERTRAEAEMIRAEAEKIQAEASRPLADLLAELKRRGIVWAADAPDEEGVLRVGVRKPDPAD